ncbi:hypothetical protein GCM10010517_78880 [Streptosporangium fragile]|uniref:Uncharacterized protein n=1 Tax=Streptosporangium fragile TaxID=46186 RepID=A0ABN3WG47_9ACTN
MRIGDGCEDGGHAVSPPVVEMPERVHPGDAQNQRDEKKPARRRRGGAACRAVHLPPRARAPAAPPFFYDQ